MWFATSRGLPDITRQMAKPPGWCTLRMTRQVWEAISCGRRWKPQTARFVATNTTLDILDRQTGRVTGHFFLRNPLQKSVSTGNAFVRLLEDRSGTIWIASARDGLGFVDRQRKALTFISLASAGNIELGAWQFSKTARERSGSAPSTG